VIRFIWGTFKTLKILKSFLSGRHLVIRFKYLYVQKTIWEKAAMNNDLLIYLGSSIILFWGVAHIIPTKAVVDGLKESSKENNLIKTVEWVAEGFAFLFIGLLVIAVTSIIGADKIGSLIVYTLSAIALMSLAFWSLSIGKQTSFLPIKICPLIKSFVALLYLWVVFI
jgi:hypothetical protein